MCIVRPSTASPSKSPFPRSSTEPPYDKRSERLVEQARFFASRGYVVVLQDLRGLYFSEGVFQKYHEFDAPDGYDTIEWIAGLDYTLPAVGMWGTSYGAHTQADAAKTAPPALAALVLTMGGLSDAWTHKVRNHGAFELGQQLGWAHSQLAAVTDEPSLRERLEQSSPSDWFDDTPFAKGENPLSAAPNFEDYYLEMQNRGDYDDYFRGIGRNWREYYEDTPDIPMLHVGGWYDSYAPGTIESFVELSRGRSSEVRLVMGPWTHAATTRSYAGDVEFGAAAAIPDFAREFHLRWFDRHLKGREDAGPPADFARSRRGSGGAGGALRHGGRRRTPGRGRPPLPRGRVEVGFLLAARGNRADPLPPPRRRKAQRRAAGDDEGSTAYAYDPEHPVPTIGGAFSGALKRGAYDQRERLFVSLRGGSENGFFASEVEGRRTADRPDVLVFETEPLEEDLVVVGPVSAVLQVSSDAPDTDFTAKLVDVYPPSADYPDGFDLNITDGILRARYRDSRQAAPPMEPGETYEIEIRFFPTANRFAAGHRIRLEISSSNYPRFDRNPNTGEPLGRHTRMVPAEMSSTTRRRIPPP